MRATLRANTLAPETPRWRPLQPRTGRERTSWPARRPTPSGPWAAQAKLARLPALLQGLCGETTPGPGAARILLLRRDGRRSRSRCPFSLAALRSGWSLTNLGWSFCELASRAAAERNRRRCHSFRRPVSRCDAQRYKSLTTRVGALADPLKWHRPEIVGAALEINGAKV
jgi:hypothetical protein